MHSVKGQSRSACVILTYLVRKFRWTVQKALDFLNSRRPGLEIRASFLTQLTAFESRLTKSGFGPLSSKWDGKSASSPPPHLVLLDSIEHLLSDPRKGTVWKEELLLRNTFINTASNATNGKDKTARTMVADFGGRNDSPSKQSQQQAFAPKKPDESPVHLTNTAVR